MSATPDDLPGGRPPTVTPGRRSSVGLTTARPQKKAEVVARQLLDRMVAERLEVGQRLQREQDLLQALGVSRSSLREAIRILEISGIVTMRTGREGGAVVQRPSPDDFARTATMFFQAMRCTYRDLILARIAIEPGIYEVAARRASPSAVAELRELWDREGDFEAHAATNRLFYSELPRAVAEASGNVVLVLLVNAIAGVFIRHMDRFNVGQQHRREAARVALLTLDAIAAHDTERVARLVRANLEAWLDIADVHHPQVLDSVVSWDS